MKHQVDMDIIVGKDSVKQVHVEISHDPNQSGWPDSIRGNLLGFKKKDWLDVITRQDVAVVFKAKRYKLSLNSDGTFNLTKDWGGR